MKEILLTSGVSFDGNHSAGVVELSDFELLMVSGGDIADNWANALAFGHSVFYGAASGGITGALGGALSGGSWAHGGLTGMAVGAVGGALNHVKGK
ncbi:hypothetical protein NDK50_10255 [Paraburkholderia bryophila]|uniref:hypothetical protein n=1 Tax=Paraburkholderia bryophila TaxID=420952 RepID=UPI00234BF223|nr:hypothetical protein [Paraburkholderia bryophila]WCM21801.1 hypothetical protein NDK50_10255 [Paraburkholderia bryophila]